MSKMTSWMKSFALVMFLCVMGGCSTTAHLRTDDEVRSPSSASSSSEVRVYSATQIGKPYQTIGVVVSSADGGDDASSAVSELRKEASELGADAVVGLRLEIAVGFWTSAVRATGVAVRF